MRLPDSGRLLRAKVGLLLATAAWSQELELEARYTVDLLANVSGGAARRGAALGNLDLVLGARLAEDWRFSLYGLVNHGDSISRAVGDLQAVSNIEAPQAAKLFEAWLERDLHRGRCSLRFGLLDLNAEFDVIPAGLLFLHSSHGIGAEFGASGRNGPSIFPTTSLAVRYHAQRESGAYARAVLADGIPGDPSDPRGTEIALRRGDGLLAAAEVGHVSEAAGRVRSKLALGAWTYTEQLDDLGRVDGAGDPLQRRGDPGLYVLAERRVWNDPALPEGGLSLFLRAGVADEDVNPFDRYLGAGAVYRGSRLPQPDDELGLGVAAARIGEGLRSALAAGGRWEEWEVAFELTYRARASAHLEVQPVVQHVLDPGGDPALGDATLVGLRLVWSF